MYERVVCCLEERGEWVTSLGSTVELSVIITPGSRQSNSLRLSVSAIVPFPVILVGEGETI